MKTKIPFLLFVLFVTACTEAPSPHTASADQDNLYLQNRVPLHPKKYVELPLGSIRAEGWLLQQLELMRQMDLPGGGFMM